MYKKFFPVIFLGLILFNLQFVCGQETLHLQHDANPLVLNPANTGAFITNPYRVVANYKETNSGYWAYRNAAFTFDIPYYIRFTKIGIGLGYEYDEMSDNFINTNKVSLSLAYHLQMGLSFGAQFSFSLISPKVGDEIWPDDLIGGSGNEETFENSSFLDAVVGLKWTKELNNHIPVLGLSVFHLTAPKFGVTSGALKMPMWYIFQFEDSWKMSKNLWLVPGLLAQSNFLFYEFSLGTLLQYGLNLEDQHIPKSVSVGVFEHYQLSGFRSTMVSGAITYNNIHVGLSFDLNYSKKDELSPIRGPMEFVIIYKGPNKQKHKLPCYRF